MNSSLTVAPPRAPNDLDGWHLAWTGYGHGPYQQVKGEDCCGVGTRKEDGRGPGYARWIVLCRFEIRMAGT